MTALVAVLLSSSILVATYHNLTWWPPDDGNYAHVAERLLSGETLHADVQDIHAGYVNLVNAGAFAVFGTRLVSLRYPLAILTVVQAGLMFLLLRPRGPLTAGVGALAFTALGFVQFLNPTANWYCLFLTVCTICWLSWVPVGARYRDVGTGFLLGSSFLFRQLSGVLLAIGVLVFLLLEWPRPEEDRGRGLARAVIVVVAVGLAAYLAHVTDVVGWLLFGVWPFPLLLLALRRTAAGNRALLSTVAMLLLGASVAALPLVLYHVAHGSVGAWLTDTFGAATSLLRLEFMKLPGYTLIAILAGRGLASGNIAERLNGFFWLALLLLTAALAVTLIRALTRRTAGAVNPLPVVALFYAIVSVHYQVTLYLFFTAGLCLAALLWQTTDRGKALQAPVLWSAAILAVIALYYQAGMPLSRGLRRTVAGERLPAATRLELDRAGIYVEMEDAVRYKRIVGFIRKETGPGDTIFALPSDAELYFLAKRTNPFKFFNTAIGIRSAADLDSTLLTLTCHPPRLIFYNREDKYNTPASVRIAALVRHSYEELPPLPPFQVFRRTGGESTDAATCPSRGGA